MTNGLKMRSNICQQIMSCTDEELYEMITGDNPFIILICNHCMEIFGECEKNQDDDALCRQRFGMWCSMIPKG